VDESVELVAESLAHRPGRRVPGPVLVDVVAIVEDEIELFLGEVAEGCEVAVLVALAAGIGEAQRRRHGAHRRRGPGAADPAHLLADAEAIPIGPGGLESADFDMDAVAELGPGQRLALAGDAAEAIV